MTAPEIAVHKSSKTPDFRRMLACTLQLKYNELHRYWAIRCEHACSKVKKWHAHSQEIVNRLMHACGDYGISSCMLMAILGCSHACSQRYSGALMHAHSNGQGPPCMLTAIVKCLMHAHSNGWNVPCMLTAIVGMCHACSQ